MASDVLGGSGRKMRRARIGGETDPAVVADLAVGALRQTLTALRAALDGRLTQHPCFLLGEHLQRIEELEASMERVSAAIARRLAPLEETITRLDAIPGVGRRRAEIILAAIGTDMAHFPSAAPLASWAGLCPGNHESAGKRQAGTTRKGNVWLRTALGEAAQAAGWAKDTRRQALFQRLAQRRGRKRAAVAVAHHLLISVSSLLKTGEPYRELGSAYLTAADTVRQAARLPRRLEQLGYRVTVEAVA